MNPGINPFGIVGEFEYALEGYTGAPHVVTTTSCTMAIFLCLRYLQHQQGFIWGGLGGAIGVPKHTYVGVPMSVLNTGNNVEFVDHEWKHCYRLGGTNIIDSARWMARGMWGIFPAGSMACLSFHWNKTLGIGQGGAILTDSINAAEWLEAARFDGRRPRSNLWEEQPVTIGYHAYMRPEDAAAGLTRLAFLGDGNDGLERPCHEEYPDLSQMSVFEGTIELVREEGAKSKRTVN